jgi:glycosyltransferase involved in cell wall biosynthesis
MIPRVAHFVFGLEPQEEPFHPLHYVALESCRRVLEPEAIVFHHKHLPWGPWWDRIRPHLTLAEVDLVPEVLETDYSTSVVPDHHRYAHHADFLRLDALIEHGGLYADIDTVFLRPPPAEMWEAPFVLGREPAVQGRPSLCNALLLAEPGSAFARAWRERMPEWLDGTWSNHSGFLAQELSERMPEAVRVEPEGTFYPLAADRLGLARLLTERHAVPESALSVHLWAHLWWEEGRRDFTDVHAGSWSQVPTTLTDLARPYLPESRPTGGDRWSYVSWDWYSGYAVVAGRTVAALEDSGLDVRWLPTVDGTTAERPDGAVVVGHIVPELWRRISRPPGAFFVGYTAWETDRLPEHWRSCLEEADLLVVPSTFNAETFAAAGVETPVAVVPHAVPPLVERPSPLWADLPQDAFVFYTVAEWTKRKAVARTVEAYLRAFTKDDRVLLVVHTSARDRSATGEGAGTAAQGTTAWALARLLAGRPDAPAVRLSTAQIGNDDIAALHRRGGCFVSLARGEGWGLGAFDAAANGNPVVTTGWGGQLDYLGWSPWVVRFELVPVHDPGGFQSYTSDQRWAEPDVDHAAELMRAIAASPDEARAAAGTAAQELRERYRPAEIARVFRAAVENARKERPTCR